MISASFAQANPAAPFEASTLPISVASTPTPLQRADAERGRAGALARRKSGLVARHAIVTAERAIHQQVGSLTRQGQL